MDTIQVFLFVNPLAGGRKGEKIMQLLPKPFHFVLPDGQAVLLSAFSLLDTSDHPFGKDAGFSELKRAIQHSAGEPVRVIAAGGDGTIKWVVEESRSHGVDQSRDILLGILPLGTGNDFSRSTGWGGKFPRLLLRGKALENFKRLVWQWCSAPYRPHDVWHVEVRADSSSGRILQMKKEERRKAPLKEPFFAERMIMYFSIGADGKVGLGFDKFRTSSRLCNNIVYALEGVKKELPWRRKHRVADVVYGLYHGTSEDGPTIFDTAEGSPAPGLVSDPQILAFLNIPSYSGGWANLWRSATRPGVDRVMDCSLMTAVQNPGDGKLEVVTVRSPARVVLDCCANLISQLGTRRVFTGAPFFAEFVDGEGEDMISYCQIDGEFYKLVGQPCLCVNCARVPVTSAAESEHPGGG